jgi:hypothetical protein
VNIMDLNLRSTKILKVCIPKCVRVNILKKIRNKFVSVIHNHLIWRTLL